MSYPSNYSRLLATFDGSHRITIMSYPSNYSRLLATFDGSHLSECDELCSLRLHSSSHSLKWAKRRRR